MNKIAISTASAPPAGPYSSGLTVGNWVFLAGQPGAGTSIEEQTHHVLDKVSVLLGEVGCTLDDVVSCLVHLADMSLFQRYNEVYGKYFREPRPVRTTVGASLVDGSLVEITVTAKLPVDSSD